MDHAFTKTGKFALACLTILAVAAVASLGVSLSAGSLRPTGPSPAEIVASRFPSAESVPPAGPPTFSTASVMPVEHWETFDQAGLSAAVLADPAWPPEATPTAVEPAESPIVQPAPQSAPIVEAVTTEPPKAPAPSAASRRVTGRSSNVLNDAQIASIKRRLKLTPEQERMWPAVEAALHKIVYTKNAMTSQPHAAQSGGASTAYIDPASAEVKQLKAAALPLLARLNDEQKREVKMLAYVMGLEAVASQF